jgi:Holliday junction resolvase RusA-like endonuclease
MRRRVTVIVSGVPVTQGSMKALPRGNGRVVVTDTKKARIDIWRTAITDAVHRQLGEDVELFTGPVRLSAAFRLPRPKSITKRKAAAGPIGQRSGDLDKYLRCLGDALTGTLLEDDAQIRHISDLTKDFAFPGQAPGVVFTIEAVE